MTIQNPKFGNTAQIEQLKKDNDEARTKKVRDENKVASVDEVYDFSFRCVNLICEHPISGNTKHLPNLGFFCPKCCVAEYVLDSNRTTIYHVARTDDYVTTLQWQ